MHVASNNYMDLKVIIKDGLVFIKGKATIVYHKKTVPPVIWLVLYLCLLLLNARSV